MQLMQTCRHLPTVAHVTSPSPGVLQGAPRTSPRVRSAIAGSMVTDVVSSTGPTSHRNIERVRRCDSTWVCPACSNPTPSAAKLVHHMRKCCNDLLVHFIREQQLQQQPLLNVEQQHHQCITEAIQISPLQHQEQQQQQQVVQSDNSCPNADIWTDDIVLQMLAVTTVQEQTLRRLVLRLQFVRDAHAQEAAACKAHELSDAADAADGDESDEDDDDPAADHPDPLPQTTVAADVVVRCRQGAAMANKSAAAAAAAASPTTAAAGSRRRRRGKALVVLRTPEQIAQALQLPLNRVMRLIERAPRSIQLVADQEPLEVVYEDDHFLAVSKPPGLRSAPAHRFMGGSALNRMIGYLGYEPHLLHRLDMNTSGVLVAAKDRATASAAHAQFRSKTVTKSYLCLAVGQPRQQQFVASGPIGPHPGIKVARLVVEGGQPALTHIEVLAQAADGSTTTASTQRAAGNQRSTGESKSPYLGAVEMMPDTSGGAWGSAAPDPGTIKAGYCLVCCRPVTGRTHQIRVHMAAAGLPLLGDELYGLQGPWINRQALHAASLTLQDPGTGLPITFAAPLPADFLAAAMRLGLDLPTDMMQSHVFA